MVQPTDHQPSAENECCYANNGLLSQRFGRRLNQYRSDLPVSSLRTTSTSDPTVVRVLTSVLHALRYNSQFSQRTGGGCGRRSWFPSHDGCRYKRCSSTSSSSHFRLPSSSSEAGTDTSLIVFLFNFLATEGTDKDNNDDEVVLVFLDAGMLRSNTEVRGNNNCVTLQSI